MSRLRERMIEDMQLRGLSANTQEVYVRAVRQLAEYVHKIDELGIHNMVEEIVILVATDRVIRVSARHGSTIAVQWH